MKAVEFKINRHMCSIKGFEHDCKYTEITRQVFIKTKIINNVFLVYIVPKRAEGRESLDLVSGLISEVPYAVLFGLIRINTLSKEQGCH